MSEPRWIIEARKRVGVREIAGPKHSGVIMGWVKKLGRKLGVDIKDDETPWCGTFMASVMDDCGIHPPPIAVRAKAWAEWGSPCTPQLGAVAVKSRHGGGHVFLIVGVTPDGRYYKALGGNQGNAVSITDIAVSDVEAVRWPYGEPRVNRPLPVAPFGAVVSEA